MTKYAKAVEQLNEAKLIISDVQRLADDEDMKDIVELLNAIGSLQAKFKKKDQ
ncbi:MAG TPA: hypothetical protein PKO25_00150 [Spirochaetota bacterium]|nr:hypothetical protein [Spirochaetota bacterium]OPZ39278.1 MAG: hypothetical protein BWY96_00333 [Spirochaetes bacterium ADurb.BinA120]HNU90267.1 hypothetical protein [Spirochaetota bacterium]HPI13244.1 hypothetical protein [Spirochaetota bacterium]HPO44348.1 hypothetical protein [Spirochaetota bacterium]